MVKMQLLSELNRREVLYLRMTVYLQCCQWSFTEVVRELRIVIP